MDTFETFAFAVAAAAVATIIASKFTGAGAWGGSQPRQGFYTRYPQPLPANSAPLAQNQPITEAAYNQQWTQYVPAFGPNENQNTGGSVILSN